MVTLKIILLSVALCGFLLWSMRLWSKDHRDAERWRDYVNWSETEWARRESEYDWWKEQKHKQTEVVPCFLVKHGETVHLEGVDPDLKLEWTGTGSLTWKIWTEFFNELENEMMKVSL